jgi:hypothetical protein
MPIFIEGILVSSPCYCAQAFRPLCGTDVRPGHLQIPAALPGPLIKTPEWARAQLILCRFSGKEGNGRRAPGA